MPLNNPLLARAIVAKENTAFNLEDIHFQFLQNDEKENLKSSNDSSNVLKLTYHNFLCYSQVIYRKHKKNIC